MLEELKDIRYTLDTAGEALDFPKGTIRGIPGQLTYNIQNYDSLYDIERQEFTFRVYIGDVIDHNILEGDTFYYTVFDRRYLFELLKSIEDGTGWANLRVALRGIDNV